MIGTGPVMARTRGAVIPIVFIVCLMCAIVGFGLLMLASSARMMGVRTGADIGARSAADAAVNRALYQMNQKLNVKPWDDSSLPADSNVVLPACDATFDYTVCKDAGVYTVTGTGRTGRSHRVVSATLRLYSPFDYAVFTRSSLELKNSTVVDWYNNQPGDWPLQVGTSSTADGAVQLKNSTTINGDLVVGAGGNPETVIDSSAGVNITGDTYPMISDPVLPTITVPASLVSMPSAGDIENTVSLSASGKYSSINLGNSEMLTITEPVVLYITSDITLGNGASICIGGSADTDNDASLTIYLAGDLEGKNSSGFNNLTLDSTRLYIYGLDTCVNLELKNDSDFRGAIYAPNASVALNNSADIYGSIVSKDFVLKNSATVYYDAALRDRTVNDDAVRFTIHRWSE